MKCEKRMESASAFVLHIVSRMQKLTTCESAVASAAPAVPISNAKMRMGSSTMLRIPPAVMPTMPYIVSPSKRSRLFITNEHIINGMA